MLGKKKLCGILTEIGIEAESREVDYAVVGIGINCAHAELPPRSRRCRPIWRPRPGKAGPQPAGCGAGTVAV
ncbi:MAG: hypothetical protein ACLUI3_15195 [Christensenellales bacterium]